MDLGIPAAALGLGLALGTSPGPVQVLLVAEAARGGAARGFRTMVAANATFGAFLLALALGLAAATPGDGVLRVVRVVGGLFLIRLATAQLRDRGRSFDADPAVDTRRPILRGVLAVLLSPGVYLFLATTGSAVIGAGAHVGGRPLALVTALALLAGVSVMDALTVLLGIGTRRLDPRVVRVVLDVAAIALGLLGAGLVVAGVRG